MRNRKQEKSLTRVYKDILVTKRQLIDLRQSISKTIIDFRAEEKRHKKPKIIKNVRQP